MLKRINNALPGLVLGIVIYGVIIQLIGVWWVERKLYYSIGLWFGIVVAIVMAINMAIVIYDAVEIYGTEHANRRIIMKSILRYAIIVVLFFILGYFHLGSIVTAFIGVLGLKISAYFQPLARKLFTKSQDGSDATQVIEDGEKL